MAIALQGVRRGMRLGVASLSALWAIASGVVALGAEHAQRDGVWSARSVVRTMVADELLADARAGFAERDLNHDGVLTRDEVPYLLQATFRRVDADGDGRIPFAEARPAEAVLASAANQAEGQLRRAFEHLDGNRDGLLQAAELQAFAGPMGAGGGAIGYEGFAHGLRTLNGLSPAAGATKYPVLLLPGFLMPASSFGMMKVSLQEAGYGHFKVLDRWPWFSDINEFADQGKFFADRLRRRTGASHIELLGHSMGGLVGRVMIQNLGYAEHVNHYVSMGTPHHGTVMGSFATLYANSALQMTPGSAFLKALNAHEGAPSAIKYTSLHAGLDEIVLPHTSVDLAGATNVEIPNVFHIPMPMMPEVCRATVAALAQ